MENLYAAAGGQGGDGGHFKNDLQDLGRQHHLSLDSLQSFYKAQISGFSSNATVILF